MSLYDDDGELAPGVAASHFMATFLWELLAPAHPAAREALTRMRDRQVRKLLDGDQIYSADQRWPRSRFEAVAGMNDILKDSRSTYEVFRQFEALMPDLARRHAYRALPAIVEARDFALAERYLSNPLDDLDFVNELALTLPLFPPEGAAPRLAAELSNFMRNVRLCEATLRGLGRGGEADALRTAALAGIAPDEMRELAQREIAIPGAITREATARRALEDRDASGE
ncbi:hypothetical protein Q4S45_03045 [Massilia sp. R2A-15]|uniref:hypothetical protein n=1 Tax=Massilia sp. R2A-15 TaxID=3064278 RepID=UPI002733308B|nr:hypothetical protein [Massilia sp. R2A-15]WLI90115.1 hypothetical protein Q4S45_03045 [Massilia sp. R2A-15]